MNGYRNHFPGIHMLSEETEPEKTDTKIDNPSLPLGLKVGKGKGREGEGKGRAGQGEDGRRRKTHRRTRRKIVPLFFLSCCSREEAFVSHLVSPTGPLSTTCRAGLVLVMGRPSLRPAKGGPLIGLIRWIEVPASACAWLESTVVH